MLKCESQKTKCWVLWYPPYAVKSVKITQSRHLCTCRHACYMLITCTYWASPALVKFRTCVCVHYQFICLFITTDQCIGASFIKSGATSYRGNSLLTLLVFQTVMAASKNMSYFPQLYLSIPVCWYIHVLSLVKYTPHHGLAYISHTNDYAHLLFW